MDRKNFYVYLLFREDGMTPFYVGMGRGKRWDVHNYRFGDSPYKDNIIQNMKARGIKAPKIKAAMGLSKDEAVATEMALIAAYGRKNNGTGFLANLTDGGEGTHNAVITEEMRALKSAQMTTWIKAHPEWVEGHSERMKLRMEDPENRAESARGARDAWADPAYREGLVETHKALAKGPGERARMGRLATEYFELPGAREAAAERTRKQFEEKPELRASMSERFKTLWADPEWRAALLLKRQGTQVRGPRAKNESSYVTA